MEFIVFQVEIIYYSAHTPHIKKECKNIQFNETVKSFEQKVVECEKLHQILKDDDVIYNSVNYELQNKYIKLLEAYQELMGKYASVQEKLRFLQNENKEKLNKINRRKSS